MSNTNIKKPRIVVDERERSSRVPNELRELGVQVDFTQLKVGDYVLTTDAAVERKTIRDFFSSVFDGRLFDQCSKLSHAYRKPFLMIEGCLTELKDIYKNTNVFYGALASVTLSYNLHLLYTPSSHGSASALLILLDHLTRENKQGILLRKPEKSVDRDLQQMYMVSSLPGVGEKLAERLLRTFKTPREIFTAPVQDLVRVPGIGYSTARSITKALSTPVKFNAQIGVGQSKLLNTAN